MQNQSMRAGGRRHPFHVTVACNAERARCWMDRGAPDLGEWQQAAELRRPPSRRAGAACAGQPCSLHSAALSLQA